MLTTDVVNSVTSTTNIYNTNIFHEKLEYSTEELYEEEGGGFTCRNSWYEKKVKKNRVRWPCLLENFIEVQ